MYVTNEYPQSMFMSKNKKKKNNVYPCPPIFAKIKVGVRGSKLQWRINTRPRCELSLAPNVVYYYARRHFRFLFFGIFIVKL